MARCSTKTRFHAVAGACRDPLWNENRWPSTSSHLIACLRLEPLLVFAAWRDLLVKLAGILTTKLRRTSDAIPDRKRRAWKRTYFTVRPAYTKASLALSPEHLRRPSAPRANPEGTPSMAYELTFCQACLLAQEGMI